MTARSVTRVAREQLLRYRAQVSHLDRKLPPGAFAKAAWGGLQDSVPRAGVISLHARVEGTRPESWEDPSLVQIWFRGGADYIVPRKDVGVFTLGSYPRDEGVAAELERLADEIHRVTEGQMLPVGEVQSQVAAEKPIRVKRTAVTGRVHIRWDASRIWLIPAERPKLDIEDARRELARRFLHWFGPTTVQQLARWTGVDARDAKETWAALEAELAEVEVDGRRSFMLVADLEAVQGPRPVAGVRLLPIDDPFTKFDHELLVPNAEERRRVLPRPGESPGYAPGGVLVDGEIVGAWQRQERRVRIHPFGRLSTSTRDAIKAEALSFPIAGSGTPRVSWEER